MDREDIYVKENRRQTGWLAVWASGLVALLFVGMFLSFTRLQTVKAEVLENNISIVSARTIDENDPGGILEFVVTLSTPSGSGPVTVNYSTRDGTAKSGFDYSESSGILVFRPDLVPPTLNRTIFIEIINDVLYEGAIEEYFTVELSNASIGSTIDNDTSTGFIDDDDAEPYMTLSGVQVQEGSGGTKEAVFTATLSTVSGITATVDYRLTPVTAENDGDYVDASGRVTFPPGVSEMPITVTIVSDYLDEDEETFQVNLANSTYAILTASQATGEIIDDDTAGIRVRPGATLITSEDGDSDTFTVTLTSQPMYTVTVGTLITPAVEEIVITPTVLTFGPLNWDEPRTITVTGQNDDLDDGDVEYMIELYINQSEDSKYESLGREYSIQVPALNVDNDNPLLLPIVIFNYKAPYQYRETFSSFDSAFDWENYASPGFDTSVFGGEYHLRHSDANLNVKSVAPIENLEISYSVETEARLVAGADQATIYGLLFDWLDFNRFYRFIIKPQTQEYWVQKFYGGWQTVENGYGWSSLINTGTASNHLRVERIDDQIRIFINGVEVGTDLLSDTTYSNGRAGLIIVADAELPFATVAEAAFNDFVITQIYE